jgi:hypothetical protein
LAATNPCELKGGIKCEIPTKSNQPILKDCKDANNEQKLTAAEILKNNGKPNTPLASACSQLVELSNTVADTDINLHIENDLKFDDYSILPIMFNIRRVFIDGTGSIQREIRNIDSIKNIPNRLLGELRLENVDFKGISFAEFLPQKGANFMQIFGCNLDGFHRLSSWAYDSKTPIVDIVNSTGISTTGPKF